MIYRDDSRGGTFDDLWRCRVVGEIRYKNVFVDANVLMRFSLNKNGCDLKTHRCIRRGQKLRSHKKEQ